MDFSPQQTKAIDAVGAWLKQRDQQVFRLFGYAGTGKTTLAKHLASQHNGKVAFAAFTGKAAKVLREKGCSDASTIHSLIYASEQDEETGLFKYKKTDRNMRNVDLVIIDECSMVGEKLANDLLSFRKPVLVLGDPAQLPPVGKDVGVFTEVDRPDFMLDEVHRQAAESPILQLATLVRQGTMPDARHAKDFGWADADGLKILSSSEINSEMVLASDAILVGRNMTRHRYNARIRSLKGFDATDPMPGETLICLRNDSSAGLLNGGLWQLEKHNRAKKTPEGKIYRMVVQDADNPGHFVPVDVWEHFFQGDDRLKQLDWRSKMGTQEFDYGYAITVHKSQGSQWRNVVLFDESSAFRADRFRWLYTGITRAAENLTLVM
jgi:exodeoxyribonuclease V